MSKGTEKFKSLNDYEQRIMLNDESTYSPDYQLSQSIYLHVWRKVGNQIHLHVCKSIVIREY